MEKWRSLAVAMLWLACLSVIACQTAGTPPQSQDTGQPQATTPAESASRSTAASYSGGARPAASVQLKDLTGGALKMLGNLYSAVTGQTARTSKAIEYAAAAAIIVVVIGAIAALSVRRHRKLSHARR